MVDVSTLALASSIDVVVVIDEELVVIVVVEEVVVNVEHAARIYLEKY